MIRASTLVRDLHRKRVAGIPEHVRLHIRCVGSSTVKNTSIGHQSASARAYELDSYEDELYSHRDYHHHNYPTRLNVQPLLEVLKELRRTNIPHNGHGQGLSRSDRGGLHEHQSHRDLPYRGSYNHRPDASALQALAELEYDSDAEELVDYSQGDFELQEMEPAFPVSPDDMLTAAVKDQRASSGSDHLQFNHIDFRHAWERPRIFEEVPYMGSTDQEKIRRQEALEIETRNEAVAQYMEMRDKLVNDLGKGASLGTGQHLLLDWFEPMVEEIQEEHQNCQKKSCKHHKHYSQYLLHPVRLNWIKMEELAVITMHETLNLAMVEVDGVKFLTAVLAIGKAIETEIRVNKARRSSKGKKQAVKEGDVEILNRKNKDQEPEGWNTEALVKVGSLLLQLLFNSAKLPIYGDDGETRAIIPAFEHDYICRDNRRIGVVKLNYAVFEKLMADSMVSLAASPRYLPMLVPPKPWTGPNDGGYLQLRSLVMRIRGSRKQMDVLNEAHMDGVYRALNYLASIKWRINNDILPVVMEVWRRGGGLAEIPSHTDLPFPPKPESDDAAELAQWKKQHSKVTQKNREKYSMRCDCKIKLDIAQKYKDEEAFYFPYNLDFRGRAYTMPPNLNHLGSDLCRGLLKFSNAKPLGEKGFQWLKVHVASLYGVDKCSFAEREKFTEENIDVIRKAVEDPLGEGTWWLESENPWQTLAAAQELIKAIDSGSPAEYVSSIPVQQDGSCNGLQHYAALGRDSLGAFQVNLLPSDRPQDVYTGVAERVYEHVKKDAESEPCETDVEGQKNKRLAKLLLNNINRKVVKQTVMTSVYGVTYVGARRQIQARLEERLIGPGELVTPEKEREIYEAASYAAKVTMGSMSSLFSKARNIMNWLAEIAKIVARENQPMAWVTPLGLPVIQPYRRKSSYQVKTLMQDVVLADHDDLLPVSGTRQKSAFPPNYVHSLDSTHMMLTALACEKLGIDFAAVHDSYWTHPADIDLMNKTLREEFINLHSMPLLEDLRESLLMRYPGIVIPPVPERGDLELKDILNSQYFFN